MKIIDLTHTITDSMPVYPGDQKPTLEQIAHVSSDGFTDYLLTTGMHVGTHIESSAHMLDNGTRLIDTPIERFIGPGILIDARGKKTIDTSVINKGIPQKAIILILTGHDKKFDTQDYYQHFPQISHDFAQLLIDSNINIVGMDTPSPDQNPFPIHHELFKHDILIIENLTNLDILIGITHFAVNALPAKFNTDAAPVRVIAQIK